ncbi:MAG: HIT domain-containing protein [Candidatus Omnitrophota bacterium]|nr:HIT domain-containing protein [Candidatus Omnitrophota bacterium]
MDKLWAPWRIKYITTLKKEKQCLFCAVIKKHDDRKNLIILRAKSCFVMLNLFPYNNGHLMISPYRHIDNIAGLNEDEMLDLMKTTALMKQVLDKTIKPHGYNIGINCGKAAGAGIAGHLHVHIVPRWQGDVNFMPVIGNTRVISQSLQQLYALLAKEIKKKQ